MESTVLPAINGYWERAEFPKDLATGLRELDIIGGPIRGYGCPGLDPLSEGLVIFELARVDGSIATFFGVHSGLAMRSIASLGSEEQQQRWLPAMVRLEKIGAFGLTEPERGSDAAHLLTTVQREGDNYILNGAKRWIGNAAVADLLIIWARDQSGGMGGFVIEHPGQTQGVSIKNISGKISKRAVLNADIILNEVRVPADNRLANCASFKDLARVLVESRYGVVWEATGLAAGCLELALQYAQTREQFGKPIGAYQLIQAKLVDMAAAVTQMWLLGYQLSHLLATGRMTAGQVALAKYNNARKARAVAQLAREIFGGNGVLLENHVARLFTDAEAVYTYEGSNEINLLIAGRELTGFNAIT
jgi:glutaryl-CoA dehydrogenase